MPTKTSRQITWKNTNRILLFITCACFLFWVPISHSGGHTSSIQADGLYNIKRRPGDAGRCWLIDSTEQQKRLLIWDCHDDQNNEKVYLRAYQPGYYNIIFVHDQPDPSKAFLCLDVPGSEDNDGTPLQQFPCNGGDNQKFHLIQRADGWEIRPVIHEERRCIDVADDSVGNGSRVNQYSCNGQKNQRWDIVPTSYFFPPTPPPPVPPPPTPTPRPETQLIDESECGQQVSGTIPCKPKIRNINKDHDIKGVVCWKNAQVPPGWSETCMPLEQTDVLYPKNSVRAFPQSTILIPFGQNAGFYVKKASYVLSSLAQPKRRKRRK